jgi:hypothetical protein
MTDDNSPYIPDPKVAPASGAIKTERLDVVRWCFSLFLLLANLCGSQLFVYPERDGIC